MANNWYRGRVMWGDTNKPQTFQDYWLNYLVAKTEDGRVDGVVLRAAISLKSVQDTGVLVTDALADLMFNEAHEHFARQQAAVDRRRAIRQQQPSFVYFIKWGDRVKIGSAVDPVARCRDLSLPESALVAQMPGSFRDEFELHKRFAAFRIESTEWFMACDELLDLIDSLGY